MCAVLLIHDYDQLTMNSVTPAAPDPSMPSHLRPEVLQAIEEAHEHEHAGNADAAINRLEQMLANIPSGADLEVLKERVTLALTVAELLVNAHRREDATRRLVEEFGLANEAFQKIKTGGTEVDKRMAFRGLVQLRDLHARLRLTGEPAPDLAIKHWLNSDSLSLAQLKGKVVLLEFWATWCKPCEQMFPKIKELHSTHASEGLTVLALTRFFMAYGGTAKAQAQEIQLIREFVDRNGVQFPVGIAEDESLQSNYGATALPMLALIDRGGLVRYFAFSPDDDNFKRVLDDCLSPDV
jgi:thiol-disulfide isomerase/thioredoxin